MKDDVINTGLQLARKMGAQVDLAVIINKNLDYFPTDTGAIFSDQWEARKYLAEKQLAAIKEANPDIPIRVVTCIGTPQQEIIEQAIDNKASMIVIGTHGRGSLSSMFMGGTAQYVVRHSPVPVLVVPFNKNRH
jgi:nucleotide-binding universal stress UspA family protein